MSTAKSFQVVVAGFIVDATYHPGVNDTLECTLADAKTIAPIAAIEGGAWVRDLKTGVDYVGLWRVLTYFGVAWVQVSGSAQDAKEFGAFDAIGNRLSVPIMVQAWVEDDLANGDGVLDVASRCHAPALPWPSKSAS